MVNIENIVYYIYNIYDKKYIIRKKFYNEICKNL